MASLGTDCGTAHVRFEIDGNVDSQVHFRLVEGQGRGITVTEFVVLAEGADDSPVDEIAWQLQGEAPARTIFYGEAPNGLISRVGPLPLRRGNGYSVAVRGEVGNFMRLRGAGTCRFTVQRDGNISGVAGCRVLPDEDH